MKQHPLSFEGGEIHEWLEAHRKTALTLGFVTLCLLWPLGLILDLMIDDTEY